MLTNDFVTKKLCPELTCFTCVEPSERCAVQLQTGAAMTADRDLRGILSDAAVRINRLCSYKNNLSVEWVLPLGTGNLHEWFPFCKLCFIKIYAFQCVNCRQRTCVDWCFRVTCIYKSDCPCTGCYVFGTEDSDVSTPEPRYSATVRSPRFVVLFEGVGKLKYCIMGNFCSQATLGIKRGRHCIGVWL